MANGIYEELDQLLDSDKIPQKVSNRLVFAAVREVLRAQQEARKAAAQVEARLAAVEDGQRRHPSLRQMWATDWKRAIFWSVVTFAVGLAWWLPIVVSDIRQPLLAALAKMLGI